MYMYIYIYIYMYVHVHIYARLMGQPTQRATNYTARSDIVTAQIFLHAKRPTAKARLEQAALAASAGAGSHTPSTASES